MPRGFQSGKRPIVSNKEIVDAVSLTVAAGVTTSIVVADQLNDYIGGVGTCPLGATIIGFYIEASLIDVSGSDLSHRIDWFIAKKPSTISSAAYPVPGATGGNNLRSTIFHEEKGIFPSSAVVGAGLQQVRTRTFVRVPKSFRRMQESAEWIIRVGSSGSYSACFKVIYKWFI